jgi:hypothetical protein
MRPPGEGKGLSSPLVGWPLRESLSAPSVPPMAPGAITLERIPWGPSSTASTWREVQILLDGGLVSTYVREGIHGGFCG